MSPVEKKIADCIMSDLETAINSTVVYIAAKAGVSEGSVINFAVSLGCKGFSQLKINLAQYASTFSVQDRIQNDDIPKQVMRKLIDRAIASFESTYDTMDENLENAVDMLLHAGKIIVIGMGHSMSIANDLAIRMMRIGLPARAETDPLLASIASAQMQEKDVVFAVSSSGRTRDVLAVGKMAHSVGAKVICLTSYASSPLSKMSDIALVAVSLEAQNYHEATTARLTQLMIGDCLIDCMTSRIGNEAIVHLDKMVEIYEENRESISLT